MKKKFIAIYLIAILIINLSFLLFNEGVVIGIKPLNYAMVFAHGVYDRKCVEILEKDSYNRTICKNFMQYHKTRVYNRTMPTFELLDNLHSKGYTRVWLSQCQTGDNNYLAYYSNGTGIYWYEYDWVSRNENKGNTIPIFIGFGFIRV